MEEIRFADGFDTAEPLALGLAAPELACAVLGLAFGYLLIHSPLPPVLAYVLAGLVVIAALGLAALRHEGRSLLQWAIVAARFYMRPRTQLLIRPEALRDGGEIPAPRIALMADEPETSVSLQPVERPWERWLRKDDDVTPEIPTAADPEDAECITGDDIEIDDENEDDDSDLGIILPIHRGDAGDEESVLEVADGNGGAYVANQSAAHSAVFVGATRRITFFSLNGGTGRTTLATEMAGLLASRGRHHDPVSGRMEPLKVALLDLDLRSANVAVRLGVPQPTVWDWLVTGNADVTHVEDFMVSHPSGLRALLGPQKTLGTGAGALEPEHVADIVHELERKGTHFIIIDIAADTGTVPQWVLNNVHDIFIVLNPTARGVQDAYRSTEYLRRAGLRHKLSYVVNRAKSTAPLQVAMGDLGGRIAASIPYDHRFEETENAHKLMAGSQSGETVDSLYRLGALVYPALKPKSNSRGLRWWRQAAG